MTIAATSKVHPEYLAAEAIKTANHVAIIKRCQQIEPLHLLAGLAATERGIVFQVLRPRNITYQLVKDSVPMGEHPFEGNSRPPGEQFAAVITAATQMASELSCPLVRNEHLLLALLDIYSIRTFLERNNAMPTRIRSETHQLMFFAELRATTPALQQALAHVQMAQTILARWGPPNGASVEEILQGIHAASSGVNDLL